MPDSIRLRVVRGPRLGEVFSIGTGEQIVVGRSREASIPIDSPGLSRRHFSLYFDGDTCWLRDLESRNGVRVNGIRVAETAVREGDTIDAGETGYVIERAARRRIVDVTAGEEGSEAARAGSDADLSGPSESTLMLPLPIYEAVAPTMIAEGATIPTGTLLAALVKAVSGTPARLYAIIDGAQAFQLAFTARLMGNRLYTLFSGALAVDLSHVGPCVVEFDRPEQFLHKWVDAIGRNAGVLFAADGDLRTLYPHLRHIFIVKDEEGQEYFFRFYDPRVLRTFVSTCTPDELREFFGPIQRWFVEGEGGDGYSVLSLGGDGEIVRTEVSAVPSLAAGAQVPPAD